MSALRWIVGLLLFLGLLFLALQNSDVVTLKFYHWWNWQAPLIFMLFTAFALGVAAGLLTGAVRSARLKRQLNRLQREHQGAIAAQVDRALAARPVLPAGDASRRPPIDGA